MKFNMRLLALVAVGVSAVTRETLEELKLLGGLYRDKVVDEAEFKAAKAQLLGTSGGRRKLAPSPAPKSSGLDILNAATKAGSGAGTINLNYCNCGGSDGGMSSGTGGGSSGGGDSGKKDDDDDDDRASCDSTACLTEWLPWDESSGLKCRSNKCDPKYDNDICCHAARWLDKGNNLRINGATITNLATTSWDSARASPWITSGKISVTMKVVQMTNHMMIGGIRKDGVQWNSHVHSSKTGDQYPDGWVWYSDKGKFSNYVPHSSSFKRWGGPNVWKTGDTVRVYLDADNKQLWVFCRGNPVASWSNINIGSGASIGVSIYDKGDSISLMQSHVPGVDNGYGAWYEWGAHIERSGRAITNRISNNWESGRATPFITKGKKTVVFEVLKMTDHMMIGCFRKDYINYDQHPHGSSVGDHHPEGWVWYSDKGKFSNYVPYGGSFKRMSTVADVWKTGDKVKVMVDASKRQCNVYFQGANDKAFTQIALWQNINIGRGVMIGASIYNSNDSLQIWDPTADKKDE